MVIIKDGKTVLKKGTDYTIKYASNKNVGTATVTVTGKGNYTGTKTATFKIVPKSTSLKPVAAGSKAFTAKWKKQTTQTTGYQLQYSLKKNFSSGNKSVKVTKKTTKKKVTGLKSKKRYYVRIRTYKIKNGKTYYSSWSKTKRVIVK